MLKIVTPPVTGPVDVALARDHLRSGPGDFDYLHALLDAATEDAQQFTGRQFAPATYDYFLNAFPAGAIELPLPPLRSVDSVSYVDPDGVDQQLAEFDVDSVNGRVAPAYGASWPATRDVPNAVTIRFECGYDDIPAPLVSAVLLLVGDLYENREAYSPVRLHENKAVERLLWPFRTWR